MGGFLIANSNFAKNEKKCRKKQKGKIGKVYARIWKECAKKGYGSADGGWVIQGLFCVKMIKFRKINKDIYELWKNNKDEKQ